MQHRQLDASILTALERQRESLLGGLCVPKTDASPYLRTESRYQDWTRYLRISPKINDVKESFRRPLPISALWRIPFQMCSYAQSIIYNLLCFRWVFWVVTFSLSSVLIDSCTCSLLAPISLSFFLLVENESHSCVSFISFAMTEEEN